MQQTYSDLCTVPLKPTDTPWILASVWKGVKEQIFKLFLHDFILISYLKQEEYLNAQ